MKVEIEVPLRTSIPIELRSPMSDGLFLMVLSVLRKTLFDHLAHGCTFKLVKVVSDRTTDLRQGGEPGEKHRLAKVHGFDHWQTKAFSQ